MTVASCSYYLTNVLLGVVRVVMMCTSVRHSKRQERIYHGGLLSSLCGRGHESERMNGRLSSCTEVYD